MKIAEKQRNNMLHIVVGIIGLGGGIALGIIGCLKNTAFSDNPLINWIGTGFAFLVALISIYLIHSSERDYWTRRIR